MRARSFVMILLYRNLLFLKYQYFLQNVINSYERSGSALARAIDTRFEVIDKWCKGNIEKIDLDILTRICYALFTVIEKILNDEKTFEREVSPLLQIKDTYPKIVIARTRHEKYQYEVFTRASKKGAATSPLSDRKQIYSTCSSSKSEI